MVGDGMAETGRKPSGLASGLTNDLRILLDGQT
jgi:hypothetical protein